MFTKILYILVLTLILLTHCAEAKTNKTNFTAGFKTIGIWRVDNNVRLDVNIWYPSNKRASSVLYGSWKILVAKNGKKAEGIFPTILLSHDTAGCRFSYHSLAAFLAKNGFIVIAPTHYGDSINNMNAIYTINQISGRIKHLNIALKTVINDSFFKNSIDTKKIGVLGFGAGGTAALILGGANPQPHSWLNFCEFAEKSDPYCIPWAKSRIDKLVNQLPSLEKLDNSKIKSIAIITPSYGMFFDTNSFQNFTAPLLIVKAENDSINRAPFHADAIQSNFNNKAVFATIKKADSFALLSACPPTLLQDLEALCTTVSSKNRQAIHAELYPLIQQFFSTTLN